MVQFLLYWSITWVALVREYVGYKGFVGAWVRGLEGQNFCVGAWVTWFHKKLRGSNFLRDSNFLRGFNFYVGPNVYVGPFFYSARIGR